MADSELRELIRQMMRAEFYPHPTSDCIRLIETHISYVLLTGEYAYKVKKAVDLVFLDFSTLEQRRHFCAEELRLNSRGAPGLYLDVLPITRDGPRLRLGGAGDAGEAVEYAVKMRQFPQECLCRSMLEGGRLGEADVLRLAAAVARYHTAAPSDERVATFGEPDKLHATFDMNYRITARFVGGPQTRAQFEETRRFTERFLSDRADLLRERIAAGRIRECHGDLHLNNVCFWENQILLFDCIEFNEAFRFVDTAYDVAFAAMDFDARSHAELGNVFVNVYAEQSGDWDAFGVLPLYLCRQAYVRAMVNSILSEEVAGNDAARRKALDGASLYYTLAWRYTQPRRGGVGLMCGLSGSGKSTVARALAKRTGAVHIRSDAVRKHLAGVPLEERGGAELYTPEMTRRTYDRLIELAGRLAADGCVVILDAKFDRVAERTAAMNVARQRGLAMCVLHCVAPHEVLRQRLETRPGDVTDATADLLDQQESQWEDFTDGERAFVTLLDTTRSAAEVEEAAVRACDAGVVPRD